MSALPTKALSVRQPWSWFIVHGFKDIENRDWQSTNPAMRYRGPVLIHASSWWNALEIDADLQFCIRVAAECGLEPRAAPSLDLLKRQSGGIVGQAVVRDIVDDHRSLWFFGQRGLVLTEQKPLPFVPCKGALGFFDVPRQVLAELQTARAP
jgi:hypothetical protein